MTTTNDGPGTPGCDHSCPTLAAQLDREREMERYLAAIARASYLALRLGGGQPVQDRPTRRVSHLRVVGSEERLQLVADGRQETPSDREEGPSVEVPSELVERGARLAERAAAVAREVEAIMVEDGAINAALLELFDDTIRPDGECDYDRARWAIRNGEVHDAMEWVRHRIADYMQGTSRVPGSPLPALDEWRAGAR